MAATTPNMALKVWNLLTDSYDHVQLAENFAKIDQHRHTEGEGRQIPTGGIENGAVSAAKLAEDSVTPSKLSLVQKEKPATEALSLGASFADVPGCTYTTTSAGTFLVVATFDFSSGSTTGTASGTLVVDATTFTTQVNYATSVSGNRACVSGSWITSAANGSVIKLQAKKSAGTYTAEATHTRMVVVQIG